MIIKPRKQFPSWIQKAGYEAAPATIGLRLAAVDQLILNNEWDFWLDISKLYLGVRVSGANINKFVETFLDQDPDFPLVDNQNLLRHLASATISIFINESVLDLAGQLALSIITTTFFGQYDLNDFPFVAVAAKIKIQSEGIRVRKGNLFVSEDLLEGLESQYIDTTDDAVADFRNGEFNGVLTILRNTLVNVKGLNEEVNVHWWLFGEYMPAIDLIFSEIDINRMVFFCSHELAKLTVFNQPLRNSKQYLKKTLESSEKNSQINSTCISTLLQNSTEDDRAYVLEGIFERISYLTPFLLAIKCRNEAADDDWLVQFKVTSNQADANKNISIVDFAEQLYRELILLRYG